MWKELGRQRRKEKHKQAFKRLMREVKEQKFFRRIVIAKLEKYWTKIAS